MKVFETMYINVVAQRGTFPRFVLCFVMNAVRGWLTFTMCFWLRYLNCCLYKTELCIKDESNNINDESSRTVTTDAPMK